MSKHQKLQMPGKCIFCGGSGLSKEHVLGKWINSLFPLRAREQREWASTDWRALGGIVYSRERDEGRKPGGIFTAKVRAVCRLHCNNGWMSKLEEAAIPVLTPLIIGSSNVLSAGQQHILARWLIKTTMVAEYVCPSAVIVSANERLAFAETQSPDPSDNWTIWIGHLHRVANDNEVWHWGGEWVVPVEQGAPQLRHAASTIYLLGDFFAHVFYTNSSFIKINYPIVNPPFVSELWPLRGVDVQWPPSVSLTDIQIRNLKLSMGRHYRTVV